MIAAIDPGSEKTGLAVLKEDGVLLIKTIIRTSALETEITDMLDHYDIKTIVMGNGTHHEELRRRTEKAAEAAGYTITVQLVNEKYTTEMGEKKYWEEHPPRGLARLIPVTFRTVPEPVDDYVAWIIGDIYLGRIKAEDVGHKKV
ncbi:MAG TPA: ribonuclease H [Veillonellaceae bacterium]|jgi:RNase H-fold protein (predicted Holliday junction resolvase)|nr:ribonuclease H [Veillonellaceae bacterium]